jgi:hypothetical protein
VVSVQEPILSFEGLDLFVCSTASEAEDHVESYDVAVYSAFDASGQVLRFEAEGWNVSLRETGDYQPDRLRNALVATFNAAGLSVAADASLDELVAVAAEQFSLGTQLSWVGKIASRLFSRG